MSPKGTASFSRVAALPPFFDSLVLFINSFTLSCANFKPIGTANCDKLGTCKLPPFLPPVIFFINLLGLAKSVSLAKARPTGTANFSRDTLPPFLPPVIFFINLLGLAKSVSLAKARPKGTANFSRDTLPPFF